MKKQMMKPGSFFRTLALTAAIAANALTAAAQTEVAPQPQITYLGRHQGKPLIQVDIENNDKADWNLTLQNLDGELLYSTRTRRDRFSQKFLIEPNDADDIQLTLVLQNGRERQSRVIRIATRQFQREDFTITRR